MTEAISNQTINAELVLHRNTPIAIVANPDDNFNRLRVSDKFAASITSNITKGVFHAKANFGSFSLQTKLPLKLQHELKFQIISKGRQIMLLVTSVNGLSPSETFLNKINTKATNSQVSGRTKPSGSNLNPSSKTSNDIDIKLAKGFTASATILKNLKIESSGGSLKNINTNPQYSQNLNSRQFFALAPTATKDGTEILTNQLLQRPTSQPLDSNLTKNVNNLNNYSSNKNKISFQPGTQLKVRVTNIVPPSLLSTSGGLPTARPLDSSSKNILTGVVIGRLGSNIVLQTHSAPLAIYSGKAIPAGATVTFEILAQIPREMDSSNDVFVKKAGTIIQETREWKGLNDLIHYLTQTNLSVAKQAVNSAIPRVDNAFIANVLFFITALRTLNIHSLFGDAPIRMLQRTRPNLLKTLNDEFQQIARLSDDSNTNEWRTIPIPIINGTKIEQIHLFMRRKKKKSGDNDNIVRFVIDLNLSKIGKLQLDGLMNENKKKFDLVIRTTKPLTSGIESKINGIFLNTSEVTGHTGRLVFKSSPPGFVTQSNKNEKDDREGWLV